MGWGWGVGGKSVGMGYGWSALFYGGYVKNTMVGGKRRGIRFIDGDFLMIILRRFVLNLEGGKSHNTF